MKRDDAEALRAILRRSDPAADGSEPTGAELAEMRDRVLRTRPEGDAAEPTPWHRSPRRTLGIATVAALLFVALGAEMWLRRAAVDATRPADPASTHKVQPGEPGASGTVAVAGRQVHFTTPGGTRIVWVLYPPLNSSGNTPDTAWDRAGRGPGGS